MLIMDTNDVAQNSKGHRVMEEPDQKKRKTGIYIVADIVRTILIDIVAGFSNILPP